MKPSSPRFALLLLASALCLPACSHSNPDPEEAPHQELRKAIEEPLDRARAVEDELQKQQENLRQQLEDAEG